MQVLVGFFLSVSALLVWRVVAPTPKPDERVREQFTQLEVERLELKRQHLRRNADVLFYGSIGIVAVFGLSGMIVTSGMHRAQVKKAQVHTYKIGESVIQIHERDLKLAAPIAMGLINAEQLRQTNAGHAKAFELYCTMADVQNRQIKALMHGHTLKALPESEHLPALAPVQIPTFRELVQRGELARGKPMILGYINGIPRRGSFLDIYSAAVAGESGSGKTSTLLFLLFSGLIAQPLIVEGLDPHYPHPKSLAFKTKALWERGVIRMATFYDQMVEALKRIEATIDNRLAQRDTSTTPVVLLIDELAFLMTSTLQEQLAYTMRRVSMEGRKCEVYMLASSQTWLASATGKDSIVRDTLTSAYVHKIKPKQANLLLQDKEETEKVKRYCRKAGDVLLCSVQSESEIARMPLTTEDDLNLVIDLVKTSVNSQHVDQAVDQCSQPTGLVKANPVDLVEQIKNTLKNEGDFSALVQSTGIDKAYLSRILNRKQKMSNNVEELLKIWLAEGCASLYHPMEKMST